MLLRIKGITMHINNQSTIEADFFEPSAYEAVEQAAKILAVHLHNSRISTDSRSTIAELHDKCHLLLTEFESSVNKLSTKSPILHTDWRLPTLKELLTLVDYSKHNTATELLDNIFSTYWSSTIVAWNVDFDVGCPYADDKTSEYLVRCVRETPKGLEWSESSTTKMSWHEAFKYAKELVAPTYYA